MKDKLLKDFENLKIENASQVKGGDGPSTSKQTTYGYKIPQGHINWEPDTADDFDLSGSTDPGVLPI